jgi:hypothetical protein
MTIHKPEMFKLIQDNMQALGPHYNDVTTAIFEEHSMQGQDWFYTLMAWSLDPEPFSADMMQTLYPYGSLDLQRQRLADAAEHGFLQAIGLHRYVPTDKGRAAMQGFFSAAQKALADVSPPDGVETARLADRLGRVIAAIAEADEPKLKIVFQTSRKTDPGPKAAPLTRIDQYLTDLYRFRDDAHLAAWQGHQISGPAWEALGYLWEDKAADLPEQIERRGFGPEKLAEVQAELVDRGWIAAEGDGYALTDTGRKVRDAAEKETNRLFFAPWNATLSEAEIQEVGNQLIALRDALNALAEASKAAAEAAPAQAGSA